MGTQGCVRRPRRLLLGALKRRTTAARARSTMASLAPPPISPYQASPAEPGLTLPGGSTYKIGPGVNEADLHTRCQQSPAIMRTESAAGQKLPIQAPGACARDRCPGFPPPSPSVFVHRTGVAKRDTLICRRANHQSEAILHLGKCWCCAVACGSTPINIPVRERDAARDHRVLRNATFSAELRPFLDCSGCLAAFAFCLRRHDRNSETIQAAGTAIPIRRKVVATTISSSRDGGAFDSVRTGMTYNLR